mgnify:CR=1 FL=1
MEAAGQEGRRVGRDGLGKGGLNEGAADQCRIEDIETDATKQRLAERDEPLAREQAVPRQRLVGDDARTDRIVEPERQRDALTRLVHFQDLDADDVARKDRKSVV